MKRMCLCMAILAAATLFGCSAPAPAGADGVGVIALVHGTLIDGTGAAPVQDSVLLIRGGVIMQAGPYRAADIPEGAAMHDLTGCTVMPGFINAHVHRSYDQARLKEWLAGGVTTVRDLAPMTGGDFLAARDRLNADPENARIVSATPIITAPGGYGSVHVADEAEAARTVKDYARKGVDIIKFSLEDNCMGQWKPLTAGVARSIVDAAHVESRRAVVHITHTRFLETAVDIGVDEIVHMVSPDALEGDMAAGITAKGILWVPTLELWRHVGETYGSQYEQAAVDNLKVFLAAGGKAALGTDYAGFPSTFDGGFPITEVELMHAAGMPAMDIIVAATRNGAVACGLGDKLGTLAPGMAADVFVVDGDPLTNLSAFTRTRMVIHGGVVVVGKKATDQTPPG